MKKLVMGVLFSGMLLGVVAQAQAAVIVDTGMPLPGDDGVYNGGWSLYNGQGLAAQFTLNSGYILTDIKGFMPSSSGEAEITVYGDSGSGVPDTSNKRYSQFFSAEGSDVGWYGLSGLNWNLDQGNYWVAFTVPVNSNFWGYMPNPSPQPQGVEAAYHPDGGWYSDDYLNLGLQISGSRLGSSDDTSAVPEPASMVLLGTGLAGLLARRRKA